MSTPYRACLQNAIGLSQTPCDCWTEKPADYNTSDSGLYLDELLPINNFTDLATCEDEDVWTIMAKSRDEAIKAYMADVKVKLLEKYEHAFKHFKGKIGEAKGTVVQSDGYAFKGIILRCNPMKSGTIKITGCGGLFNGTGTRTIYVYDNLGNHITDFEISTTANVYTNNTLATAIELPLYSDETEYLHYFFFYADEAIKPLNNYITCQYCGYTPCWSMDPGCFASQPKNNRFHWINYVQTSGIAFNNISDLYETSVGFTNMLFGLTLDIDAYCNVDDVFCTDDINYNASAIALAQAFAIRYKAAEFAIRNNLLSDKLTRANLINRETLMAMEEKWKADYMEKVDWIVNNIDVQATSCLKCRDKWNARTKLALS